MKNVTKRKNQLKTVKHWLKNARPAIEDATLSKGWQPEFDMLIAMEQLVKYCEMLEEKIARDKID